MLTLYPYLHQIYNVWVFDDARTGLKEEAFISGMSEMIHRVVNAKNIPNASNGFLLSFSNEPIEGHDVELNWTHQGFPTGGLTLPGNWYKGNVVGLEMEGWLCEALALYFHDAPKKLYVRADPLPEGVNPVWNPEGVPTRRFVSGGE